MQQDSKTIAIIAHITLIGWLIALVMHGNNKSEYSAFYLRQTLGIMIAGVIANFVVFIPLIGWAYVIAVIAAWVISLVNCVNESTEPLPYVGEHFQEWFQSI